MSSFEFTSPGGKKYTVAGPDGATKEQAFQMLQNQLGAPTTTQSAPNPTDDMSTFDKVAAGAGSGLADLGLGVKQLGARAVDAATRTFSNAPTNYAADVEKQVAEKRALDAPLLATTGGKAGAIVGKAMPAVVAAFVPGGQTLLGSIATGGALGAAEPTVEGESTLKNMMYGGGGGAAGYGAGKLIGYGVGKMAARTTEKGVQNKLVDEGVQAARDAGYSIPPSQSNPGSIIANTADIIAGGRPKLAQAAAIKNQPVTNRLAAKALGLPEDAPLTYKALDTVRKNAYSSGYLPVKQSGEVVPGAAYTQALDAIEAVSKGANRSFPGAVKNEIPDMLAPLRVAKFDAGDAVDMTRVLRDAADKAYRTGDNALGKASKDAAKALEDALEQHLTASGMTDALSAFKGARALIAKSYSVQKGLNDTTGNVSAKALAAQLKAGKPLTGDLESIARAAQLPGKSLQDLAYSTPGASQLEGVASVGGAIASSNPLLLGIPYARAGLRSALLSGPVQRAIPAPSYNSNMLRLLASDPARLSTQVAGEMQRSPQLQQQ